MDRRTSAALMGLGAAIVLSPTLVALAIVALLALAASLVLLLGR